MLSISTNVSGRDSTISRAAVRPLTPGRAQSISTTLGRSSRASFTASAPSLASPATRMSGASSSRRRKPRRTSAWSSTSKTEILAGICELQTTARDLEPYQRAARIGLCEFDGSAQQLRTFTHRDQTYPMVIVAPDEPTAVILDFQFQ